MLVSCYDFPGYMVSMVTYLLDYYCYIAWNGCTIACLHIHNAYVLPSIIQKLTKLLKDTLWVLRRDEPLVHKFVDILLITKHFLDHDVSLES